MLRNIVEEIQNEGLIEKAQTWLIKNTNVFKKMYFNMQKKYGQSLSVVENSVRDIDFLKEAKGFAYYKVKTIKGSERLMMIPTDSEYYLLMEEYLDFPTKIMVWNSKLSELENNGITPYAIARVTEVEE